MAKKLTPVEIVRQLNDEQIEDLEGKTIRFRKDSPFVHDRLTQMH